MLDKETQLSQDLIESTIDSLLELFFSSLLYDYTKERIIDNPIIACRLKKVVKDELSKMIKVEV